MSTFWRTVPRAVDARIDMRRAPENWQVCDLRWGDGGDLFEVSELVWKWFPDPSYSDPPGPKPETLLQMAVNHTIVWEAPFWLGRFVPPSPFAFVPTGEVALRYRTGVFGAYQGEGDIRVALIGILEQPR